MRILLQRVSEAAVHSNGELLGNCKKGLVLLLGVGNEDSEKEVDFLLDKCINLRIFSDENGKMNLSLLDVQGEILLISQFTLYADSRRGRRPSYTDAAEPTKAEALYKYFHQQLQAKGIKVATGKFAADMQVSLVNDGPVTIWLEKEAE